jgi:hypothetical protein
MVSSLPTLASQWRPHAAHPGYCCPTATPASPWGPRSSLVFHYTGDWANDTTETAPRCASGECPNGLPCCQIPRRLCPCAFHQNIQQLSSSPYCFPMLSKTRLKFYPTGQDLAKWYIHVTVARLYYIRVCTRTCMCIGHACIYMHVNICTETHPRTAPPGPKSSIIAMQSGGSCGDD